MNNATDTVTAAALPRPRRAHPLRVLHVVHRFLPELGGTENHVAEVTRRLAQHPDLDVAVLTTDRSGYMRVAELVNGVPVLRKRSWPRDRDYYFAPGLSRGIERGDWDLIHFQGIHTLVPPMGMVAARRAGIPYVLTFHSGGHSSTGRSAVRGAQFRALSPLIRGAAGLVAVSRFERRLFSESTGIPAERFQVINNGGALPAVPDGVAPVPGRIISSGRLEKYKGHHIAIEALARVRAQIPDAELVILGAGPYESELRRLASKLDVAGHVTIRHIPPSDRAAMAAELAGASVMAALSTYEANPVSVMEAVTIGLPVVGFDVAGIADLVEDGLVTGIPRFSDTDAVVASLVTALRTTAGTRSPREVASWDACADQLATLYFEASAGGRTRVS